MPRVITRIDDTAVLAVLAADAAGAVDDVDRHILQVAAEVLVDAGLEGFELDAVAAASGVGRSTIYRRFGGRNRLLSAAVAHDARRFFADLAEATEHIADPVDRTVAAFVHGLRLARDTGFVARIRDEPELVRVLTVDGGTLVAAAVSQLVVEASRRAPSVSRPTAAAAAEMLVRLAISFVLSPPAELDVDDEGLAAVISPIVAPAVRAALDHD